MHKGRSYPLTYHRGWNGDAPYPDWIARRYEIHLPPANGTLAPYLSGIFITTASPSVETDKLLFECDFSVPLDGVAFFFDLRLWLDNLAFAPQQWDLKLTYLQAMPPAAGVIAAWKRETNFVSGRQIELLLDYFVPDPAAYHPSGPCVVQAEAYH